MIVELAIFCANCEEELVIRSMHISDEGTPRVHADEFSQTSWICPNCGHTLVSEI